MFLWENHSQFFNNLGIFSSRFKILSRLLETSTVRRRYSREKRSNFLLFARLFVIQKVAFSRLFLNMENIEMLTILVYCVVTPVVLYYTITVGIQNFGKFCLAE